MGWLAGYGGKRRKVTADSTLIPGDVTNMVLTYDFSTYSTGGEIRVTTSDGETELAREVQSGQIYWKVAGTLSSSVDTDFYIYYDDGTKSDYAVTATYGRNNVWTSYDAVFHLEESAAGTGTAGVYIDSTGNGFDGVDNISATGKTGKVNAGQQFDGVDDFIRIGDANTVGTAALSVSFWIDFTNIPASQISLIGMWGGVSNERCWGTRLFNSTTVRFLSISGTTTISKDVSISIISTGNWYHFSYVYNAGGFEFFLNGASQGTNSGLHSVLNQGTGSPVSNIDIGSDYMDGVASHFGQLSGYMDNISITNTVLSADYIATLYNNQDDPTTFFTLGVEETPGGAPTFTPLLMWF